MKRFFCLNELSVVFFLFFLGGMVGQIIFGLQEYNKKFTRMGWSCSGLINYFKSGHFFEATFENCESEFFANGTIGLVYDLPLPKRII